MRNLHILLTIFFFISLACDSNRDRIVVPGTSSDYYVRSVMVLEGELNKNPNNLELIKLQLSYYRNLDWPITAMSAIKRASGYVTVDPEVKNYILSFYTKNNLHRELVQFLMEQERLNSLSDRERELKMKSLLAIGEFDKAMDEVNILLRDPSPKDHLTVGKIYSFNDNNILSMYHYYKAFSSGLVDSVLCFDFAPDLYEAGFVEVARQVIENCDEYQNTNELKFLLGRILLQTGEIPGGLEVLKDLNSRESHFFLSEWYQDKNVFDSSVYFVNQVVLRDSSDLEALMRVGNLFEERGYLSRSLIFYNKVLFQDSTYMQVKDQINLVRRKIAYLQRLREKEQEIPILELESIKDIDQ